MKTLGVNKDNLLLKNIITKKTNVHKMTHDFFDKYDFMLELYSSYNTVIIDMLLERKVLNKKYLRAFLLRSYYLNETETDAYDQGMFDLFMKNSDIFLSVIKADKVRRNYFFNALTYWKNYKRKDVYNEAMKHISFFTKEEQEHLKNGSHLFLNDGHVD